MNVKRRKTIDNKRANELGIGMVEILIVVAIVGIVSASALINFRNAQKSITLQNSVRQLAAYMEKARIDAVRRHGTSNVTFTNANTYVVRMDFTNNGSVTDRRFSFPTGIELASSELPNSTFDWRGRTSSAGTVCVTTFSIKNTAGEGLSVDVSGSGDVTVENQLPALPSISYTNMNASSDVNLRTAVSGSTAVDNSPCVSVAGTHEVSSGPPNCAIHLDKNAIYIKKNGGATGSVRVTMSNTSLVVVTKPSNLTVSPTTSTVSSSGTTFLISSNNTLRGPFDVTFSSQCGSSLPVRVNVTN